MASRISTPREGEAVSVCIRPEALQIVGAGRGGRCAGWPQLEATIVKVEFIGAHSRLDVVLAGGAALKVAVLDDPAALAEPGSSIVLAYDPARVIVFRQGVMSTRHRAARAIAGRHGRGSLSVPRPVPALSVVGRAQRQRADAGRDGLHARELCPGPVAKLLSRQRANTLIIGLLATITTTLIAVPLAFAIARLDIPGKLLLIGLAALPLVLPSFVGAYALLLLFGRSGIVTQFLNAWGVPFGSIYGMPGIVAVYTLTLYPYVLLPTVAGLKAIDISVEEAAQSLGSSPARTFRTITLPIVIPSVLSGAMLVLIETIENFGVPAVLAEDMPILSVEAYKLFIGETATNPSAAGVLGVLLIASTATVLIIQRRYLASRRFATGARGHTAADQDRRRLAHRWRPPIAGRVVLLALVPFFAIVVLSFMEFRGPVLHAAFSLKNYAELFATASGPLANTLLFATLAAAAAAFIGVPVGWILVRTRSAWTSLLDVTATLPFAVAGTVLAIGLVIAFNAGGLVLTGGWLIMVLAYTVRKLPFTVRASSAILHQIDPSLEEASISLGVSPLRTCFALSFR